MSTIAFLFKGDETRLSDFDLICEAIFQAVLTMNPKGSFHLRSGRILLTRFSERTTAVSRGLVAKRKSFSYTVSDDKELRATLAVAFAASAGAQHHHLEVGALPEILLRHPVECVTVSDTSLVCGDAIHKDLKQELAGYLGWFEVDLGDPLTLEVAANGLIPFCHYHCGILKWIVPFDRDPNVPVDTSWARNVPFFSIEMTSDVPQHIPGQQLSAVGKKNTGLLKSRARSHHAERVLASLLDNTEVDEDATEFEIKFGQEEFGKPRADVRKLQAYCLNEQHTKPDGTPGDGRGKAYLFRHLLGITRNDWLFLGEQLVAGLEKALPNKTRKNAHGVQYDVTVSVTGRNGETKLVKCGWIIRAGESPFLTTAYIADDADTTERGLLAPLIVEKSLGLDFLERVYDTAHQHAAKAAEDWTPTPMWVEGYTEAFSEGACGSSWVRLPDARSRFARWLKKKDLGSTGHGPGCFVFARTTSQSLERAQRYSEGFASVLRLNGIECEVGWRYD